MALNDHSPCFYCATIRDYIATHYDPGGHLTGDEDPAECMAHFDRMYENLGGDETGCEIDQEHIAAYLAELRERPAVEAR